MFYGLFQTFNSSGDDLLVGVQQKITKLHDKVKELKHKNKALDSEVRSSKDSCNEALYEQGRLAGEAEQLNKRLLELTKEIFDLKSTSSDMRVENNNLKNQVHLLKQNKVDLAKQMDEAHKTIDKLTEVVQNQNANANLMRRVKEIIGKKLVFKT